jgi:uncharacterized membrane protein YoaK (UPF0700 family)
MASYQTRRIIRVVRKRSIRFMRGQVPLQELPQAIAHTLDRTLELMPLDSHMLMNHNARNKVLDRQMAWSLAFVAGATNAGGFLAVRAYTSHMSGTVSRAADMFALGQTKGALAAASCILFFALGAATTSLLVSLGRRHRFRSHYAFALALEGVLLLVFGMMGPHLAHIHRFMLPATVILLCFTMGMQNAIVTTISNAEVRTTHMTGVITDLGIELSRLFYLNLDRDRRIKQIRANRDKLKLHGLILVSFFGGGILGALGFKHIGFKVTVFLAGFLFLLAVRPLFYDLRVRWKLMQQHAI